MSTDEPPVPPEAAGEPPPPPPALVASSVFGAIGLVALVGGLLTGLVAVSLVGVALGTLSLGAALVWRSQLIEAWRRDHPPRAR